jgi:hypothetical protein
MLFTRWIYAFRLPDSTKINEHYYTDTARPGAQLVAASLEPGPGVSAIAREAGTHPSQLNGVAAPIVLAATCVSAVAALESSTLPLWPLAR